MSQHSKQLKISDQYPSPRSDRRFLNKYRANILTAAVLLCRDCMFSFLQWQTHSDWLVGASGFTMGEHEVLYDSWLLRHSESTANTHCTHLINCSYGCPLVYVGMGLVPFCVSVTVKCHFQHHYITSPENTLYL